MSIWSAKRFWKAAMVVPDGAGFAIHLDGRPVRTPGQQSLILPSRNLAQAVAAEWDAQEGKVDPATMPATRTANTAIDRVAPQQSDVAEIVAAYGDADLLCYRAESPAELVARQAAIWDPLLDWAADALGARLLPVNGIVHQPQDATTLKRLDTLVRVFTPFQLAAFHDLVSLSGSLVLGFAAAHQQAETDALWAASRLDEIWQVEQWGADDQAEELSALKKQAFVEANRFFHLSDVGPDGKLSA